MLTYICTKHSLLDLHVLSSLDLTWTPTTKVVFIAVTLSVMTIYKHLLSTTSDIVFSLQRVIGNKLHVHQLQAVVELKWLRSQYHENNTICIHHYEDKVIDFLSQSLHIASSPSHTVVKLSSISSKPEQSTTSIWPNVVRCE